MTEHEHGDEGHVVTDLQDDAGHAVETPSRNGYGRPWRPFVLFRWVTAAGVFSGSEGLHSARTACGRFAIEGYELEHAWGVGDGMPWAGEVEADEEVAREERHGVPGAIGPADVDEGQVCLEAEAVEGGVSASLGLAVGVDGAPGWTATARRLAPLGVRCQFRWRRIYNRV